MQYPHDIMLKTYTLQYWQYINFCINRKEKKDTSFNNSS